MSRSYRASIWTEGYGGRARRSSKAQANRRVRRTRDMPVKAKASYKRYYSSWDICDYKFEDTTGRAKRK